MPENVRNERRLLGGAVKRLREAKGIKQDMLATDAGIHFAYLSKIERGKQQPSVEVIARLANGLEVDIDDISYMAVVYIVAEIPAESVDAA